MTENNGPSRREVIVWVLLFMAAVLVGIFVHSGWWIDQR